MKRKVLAVLLAASMAVTMLTGCGNSSSGGDSSSANTEVSGAVAGNDSQETSPSGDYDQVVYAFATFNNIPTEEALDEVEEAINVITREKINAEITLKPISFADYSQSISLSLQGGEKIDIMESVGDFNNYLSTGMAMDISSLIDEYAPQTKALVGDEWLAACEYEGDLYGIPDYKPLALTSMVIYREDVAEELGIDMSQVNSVEDLTEVFAKVKEGKPEMTPLTIVETGNLGVLNMPYGIDYLSDDYTKPTGVLMGDDMTVQNFYTTDYFKDKVTMIRDWYNKGYVMKDAATTTSTSQELMSSGNYFCWIAGYSYPEEDTAASFVAQCGGHPLAAKTLDKAYMTTGLVNMVSWMLAANTKVPEAAMKFLELTYTDAEISNLIIWGIEGRDYVLDEEGYATYPEGQDASTVPYTAQISCGVVGNQFIQYLPVGSNYDSLEWELEQNQSAEVSPAMGFAFDAGNYTTQYTAVNNVLSQYLPGLLCGSLDPGTELPKMLDALDSAGLQTIIDAKQEQLDAWMAE